MTDPLFTGINHVCVVTSDMDRAVRRWSDAYGAGPWRIWRKDSSNFGSTVDGEPCAYEMLAAMCDISPTFRIELIQPLDDQGPYSRSLARFGGRDHVHHIRFDVADYATARARLDDLGVPVAVGEDFAGASASEPWFSATYFATDDELGFVLQIGEAPPGFAMPEPDSVYPAPDRAVSLGTRA